MKKLLLGVIAFALIITSCNKYEDDFKDLNAKIDALKAQVAGVAALQTGLIAAQAQLTALSAAVAALPNPTASIATLGTNLAALSTKVTTVQTALDKLAVDVAAGKVTSDAAAVKVAELQTALALAQADIVKILANTSMYVGNVSITSDAEVNFWTPKIAQLGMINGTLTVTTSGISTTKIAAMNLILKNVNAVIGGTTGGTPAQVTITASSGKNIDLSKLTSVVGDFTAVGTAPSGESIDGLQSILNISSLTSVTGNFKLDFDGPYALPLLSTVGGTMFLETHTASTTAPIRSGTTTVNFPLVSVTGTINGGAPNWPLATTVNVAGNMTTFDAPKATTVVLRGNYTAGLVFNAALATSVSIGAATAVGPITINAAVATSVSLPSLTTIGAGNAFGITTSAVTVVALPLLATSGDITINMGANNGSVDLSLFASSVAVTVTGPQTLSLPKYVTGQLTASKAKTVTLAKHGGSPAPSLAVVENLTMGALNVPVNLAPYTALISANISGKTQTVYTSCAATVTATAANAALTTVTVGGVLNSVSITGVTTLTSVSTSGVVNSFEINGCTNAALTSLGLAHTHFIGGPGSTLKVIGCTKLTSLRTSTDYAAILNVSGNSALASCNFASYVTTLIGTTGTHAAVAITIGPNKLTGVYTAPVAATLTTPFVEAKVASADLLTLKAYIALLGTKVSILHASIGTATDAAATIDLTLSADLYDSNGATTGTPTLVSVMTAFGAPSVTDATAGINTIPEYALVQ